MDTFEAKSQLLVLTGQDIACVVVPEELDICTVHQLEMLMEIRRLRPVSHTASIQRLRSALFLRSDNRLGTNISRSQLNVFVSLTL
jgi:hypothetical protein